MLCLRLLLQSCLLRQTNKDMGRLELPVRSYLISCSLIGLTCLIFDKSRVDKIFLGLL